MAEMRADPVELARVAQAYVDSSRELFDATRNLRADTLISTSDLGNVAPAAQLSDAHANVLGSAGTALEKLIAVLEVDSENLYRVAFAYRQTDDEADRRFRRQYPNLPI